MEQLHMSNAIGVRGFEIGELEYCVGPSGASDAVTGIPCAVVSAAIWIGAVIYEATNT